MTRLEREVRAVIVCPRCHGPLLDEADSLRCDTCHLRYPVRSGIPVLVIDEAEQLAADSGER